jgi:hypothetical protein
LAREAEVAVYISGKTRCPLCGQLALQEEPFVNIPPVFANQLDPAFAIGLQDEQTAAITIAHELGHLTEVGP